MLLLFSGQKEHATGLCGAPRIEPRETGRDRMCELDSGGHRFSDAAGRNEHGDLAEREHAFVGSVVDQEVRLRRGTGRVPVLANGNRSDLRTRLSLFFVNVTRLALACTVLLRRRGDRFARVLVELGLFGFALSAAPRRPAEGARLDARTVALNRAAMTARLHEPQVSGLLRRAHDDTPPPLDVESTPPAPPVQ